MTCSMCHSPSESNPCAWCEEFARNEYEIRRGFTAHLTSHQILDWALEGELSKDYAVSRIRKDKNIHAAFKGGIK